MITIVYSTHKDNTYNDNFENHLKKSCGLENIQILRYVNHNEFSLSHLYNKGIEESNFDIVVCVHNDIKLEKGWGKKLLSDFKSNPDFAIIGKAGSCYFPKSGVYWERMHQTMVGQVYHQPEGKKKWLSKYSPKLPFLIPVVTIDGLFISFDKTKIKHKFDETIGKFHFYDHLFCLPNYLDGVKIGVTSSFEITHESVGQPNAEFFETKKIFLDKFENNLPLDLKPDSIYVPIIESKKQKKIDKVAVIIPNKSNNNLLISCINSFEENCDQEFFDIFVADTGSTKEEIDELETYINKFSNIKLIKYNYYNFAKINNDVVKNYINDEYKYLLFCNNDIKILNNVIYGMLKVFKSYPKVGTVGARLHFKDNTVQHDGIVFYMNKEKKINVTHRSLSNYYNHSITTNKVVGNTAALMMMEKKTFEKCGFFNESYEDCFEDVELNLMCIILGLSNYCDSSLCAYHYESQTRNLNENKLQKLITDFNKNLIPFIGVNFNKLKSQLFI